ncbi:hypothetical protein [Ancylobacter pratisalsi]|uniref:Uncharacterized protein n=1 Tax=Ancylobacter pratisalsi TaxID=1745854 RepID=A0A6P1YQW8_9HYPH|nr:hypothetical protein [Ancylobacter pratisalsi]QIB35181.1 hypothetical protein G3A50_16785 [Ancylobacter pratisalsi]
MSSLLDSTCFVRAARGGLGSADAATAAALAFFDGALYLGTGALATGLAPPPARLMRLEDGQWLTVLESAASDEAGEAVVDADLDPALLVAVHEVEDEARATPDEDGYVALASLRMGDEETPALYVGTASPQGGRVLRSPDGLSFEPVSEPGFGNPACYAVASLCGHDGRLFAATRGAIEGPLLDTAASAHPVVHVCLDPVAGAWREASLPGFGDPDNRAITSLASVGGYLYAGTCNDERGFQLWRTRAEGEAPFAWEQVLVDGAFAFNANRAVAALAGFGDALYVGTQTGGPGYAEAPDLGQDAAELIRVNADGSWDLVVGQPRFTPIGIKAPMALMGAGFDDPYNAAFESLCAHEGALYLGTRHWGGFAALGENEGAITGGYQLWASPDGTSWELVLEDGAGNPAAVALTSLISTPEGLFAGSANVEPLLSLAAFLKDRDGDLDTRAGFEILRGR